MQAGHFRRYEACAGQGKFPAIDSEWLLPIEIPPVLTAAQWFHGFGFLHSLQEIGEDFLLAEAKRAGMPRSGSRTSRRGPRPLPRKFRRQDPAAHRQ